MRWALALSASLFPLLLVGSDSYLRCYQAGVNAGGVRHLHSGLRLGLLDVMFMIYFVNCLMQFYIIPMTFGHDENAVLT